MLKINLGIVDETQCFKKSEIVTGGQTYTCILRLIAIRAMNVKCDLHTITLYHCNCSMFIRSFDGSMLIQFICHLGAGDSDILLILLITLWVGLKLEHFVSSERRRSRISCLK